MQSSDLSTQIRKTVKHLTWWLLTMTLTQSAWSVTVQEVYNHLKENFPTYDNVTYATPTQNVLAAGWLMQTPNIWGTPMKQYNMSFTPYNGNRIDPKFHVPACKSDTNCRGIGKCRTAAFTRDDRKLCLTPAHIVLERYYQLITSAESTVDITTFSQPFLLHCTPATGAFQTMLKNAVHTLAEKNKPIRIRILGGTCPPIVVQDSKGCIGCIQTARRATHPLKAFLQEITGKLPLDNQITLSVASKRSNAWFYDDQHASQQDLFLNFSMAHGNVVVVDGTRLITGGQNLWGPDYLEKDPVNDFAMQIAGPVVAGASTYTETLWQYVCANPKLLENHCYTYSNKTKRKTISKTCAEHFATVDQLQAAAGNNPTAVQAMFVNKLNHGVGVGYDADQSEPARVFAIKNAQTSVKIAQQAIINLHNHTALLPHKTPNGNVLDALASAMCGRGVEVYIATSNLNKSDYSSNVSSQLLRYFLSQSVEKTCSKSVEEARAILDQHLHLATLSYSGRQETKARLHHKLWIVDDHLFYVGSHNFYPTSLQQFGVIIDSEEAAKTLLTDLWDPMWTHSFKKV